MSEHNEFKDTIEYECLRTLIQYFPEFNGLIKTTRPDWTSPDGSIGLETTSPVLKSDARARRGFVEFRGKNLTWALGHKSRMDELHSDFCFINENHDLMSYSAKSGSLRLTVLSDGDYTHPVFDDHISIEDVTNPDQFRFITCFNGLNDTKSYNEQIIRKIQKKIGLYGNVSSMRMILHVNVVTCFEEDELIECVYNLILNQECPFERVIIEFIDRFVVISHSSDSIEVVNKMSEGFNG